MSVQDAPPPAPAVEDAPEERPAPVDEGTASGASVRTLWRRCRVVILVALAILVVATVIGLAQSRGAQGRLDPRSADPDGGRALATLLGDRGVRVDRVTDPTTLATGLGSEDAVLVAIPGLLSDAAARALGDSTQGSVVLVNPDYAVLEHLTGHIRRSSTEVNQVRSP